MAFTLSQIVQTTLGNKKVRIHRVTADAAEANLTTGLQIVEAAFIQPELGQTMPAAHINKNSSGTASNGTVGVSGTSSANIFHMISFGR